MKKLFEDDPRAEEYDKYGRYLPKSAELVRQSTSSMSFVKDHQEGLAEEILKDSYKNNPIAKSERKKQIIARMNVSEKKEYIRNSSLTKKSKEFIKEILIAKENANAQRLLGNYEQ